LGARVANETARVERTYAVPPERADAEAENHIEVYIYLQAN